MNTKIIFITGGVSSSLGKGIVGASLAKLLQARGYRVTIQKLDPYLNVDPGTLNPYEHGECFVTNDGTETDLDLGHYERFLSIDTTKHNNITTGKIYQTVIERERKGDFLGKTVQVIPHITDEIKNCVLHIANKEEFDFLIVEIGGTVGDIESLPYIEAIRQLKWDIGATNCLIVHLTYIPYLAAAGELKTKPTQHSVQQLQEYGLQADVLVCRTEHKLDKELKHKIAQFCNVTDRAVIEAIDAPTIYEVPLLMLQEELDVIVLDKLQMNKLNRPDMEDWKAFVDKVKNPTEKIRIAIVGKYVELQDAYKSIAEAFIHAGTVYTTKVKIDWIHSEDITPQHLDDLLHNIKGLVVAPGFGERGIEGKILAIQYAREHKIPFLGICLGMQCAVVEFARNVLGYQDAHSTEMNKTTSAPVIHLQEKQKKVTHKGGTMRLGAYSCTLKIPSLAYKVYGQEIINERHRHRYEFNNEYRETYEKNGMLFTGINVENNLVEMIELQNHPFFIGVQFHPEYKSRVSDPHPLFVSFVGAALKYKKERKALKKQLKNMHSPIPEIPKSKELNNVE